MQLKQIKLPPNFAGLYLGEAKECRIGSYSMYGYLTQIVDD